MQLCRLDYDSSRSAGAGRSGMTGTQADAAHGGTGIGGATATSDAGSAGAVLAGHGNGTAGALGAAGIGEAGASTGGNGPFSGAAGSGGAGGGRAGIGGGGDAGMAGRGLSGTGGGLPGAGTAAAAGSGGQGGSTAGDGAASGETGRLTGMTAAHNALRATIQTTTPLPSLTWSTDLAAYAQAWADSEAMSGCSLEDRGLQELKTKGYGENIASFLGSASPVSDVHRVVDGWASEAACWTYGTIGGSAVCDKACFTALNSDSCSHYTAIVWRNTTQVGCGVASCKVGGGMADLWVCNYSPAGNFVGESPY